MPPAEPHDEFLELCAVSTSGQLTEDEQKRLQEHLATCPSCREALQQYEAVVGKAIPAIAADEEPESAEPGPSWSQEKAEKALFERLRQEDPDQPNKFSLTSDLSTTPHRFPPPSGDLAWRQIWMLYAAGILFSFTLGVYAYRAGVHHKPALVQQTPLQPSVKERVSIEEQLSDASHEREIARTQIGQRDKMIADLRRQLAQQSVAMKQVKAAQARLESDLRVGDASRQGLIRQRTDLAQKLDTSQTNAHALEEKLDSLAQQAAKNDDLAQASEAKANDLARLLRDREAALEQQQQLLGHDRDIRELIGARDLYIAEVYDVARTGETMKPYGRVFYTRGKSLIFYAYDLDQQTEAKKTNAFQVWGRRGPDRQQALSLGIFYEDNATRKRWILKCDDPKTLAQIDAVFVTVEPNGGSYKPSGNSLLFAYLRVNPNHP